MKIIHEWLKDEAKGKRFLRTTMPAIVCEMEIPPAATMSFTMESELEKRMCGAVLAALYIDAQPKLEPLLRAILELSRMQDAQTRGLLQQMLNEVREIAYAIPPLEVSSVGSAF